MIGKTRLVVSARYVFRPHPTSRYALRKAAKHRRQQLPSVHVPIADTGRCAIMARNFPSGPNCRRNSLFWGDPALHHRLNAVRKRMIDQPAASALVALEDPIEPVHREVIPHQMGKVDIMVAVLDPA